MMPTIHMPRGIPASGKSTYAKTWAATDPDNRVRVSRDDIRRMITGTEQTILTYPQEQHVSELEKQIALTALQAGKDVVIDAMNLRNQYVRPWMNLGFPVEFIDFPVDLDLALARNESRGGKVPEKVLRSIYQRYTRDGVLPAPPVPDPPMEAYVPDLSLPPAVLVDMDGTLAHFNGRGPFEWGKVSGDILDKPVAGVVDALHREGLTVIVMSGRSDVCRKDTLRWLKTHEVPHDHLFMRAAGDNRPDTVIKAELFKTHIRDRYNVHLAIDDRDSVVRQWRAMGLKCLQAAEGNF